MHQESEASVDDHDEVEISLETSPDAKEVLLTFKSSKPMDLHDFIMALEDYLNDMIRAYKGMPEDSSQHH